MKKSTLVRTFTFAAGFVLQLSTLCFQSRGAVGEVDLSFDPGSGVNGSVNSVMVQPDGKVLIAGSFTTVRGLACTNVARLNADGSGDSSFAAWTFGLPYGFPVGVLVLQTDGKVLLSHYCGIDRLNSDGSRDTSFNANNFLDSWGDCGSIYSIAVQSDGKVLVAGNFLSINGTNWNSGIARLNPDGSLDTNFNAGTGLQGYYESVVYCAAVQSDGKVLISGAFTTVNGTNLARLNPNGQPRQHL